MSCCEGTSGVERFPGTGCCGSSCVPETRGCSASAPRIRSCFCQSNVGCLDRTDCGGFRPTGTAATGACPGPCQCAEEEVWNSNVPPKPNCEWLSNFSELRRQWSDHARQQICKCCNCKPRKTAVQCQPCLPLMPCCSTTSLSPSDCQESCDERRLAGGASDKPEETSTEVASVEPPPRREAGGGCPPPGCNCGGGRCSSATDRSSCASSSWCPTNRSVDLPMRRESQNTCQPCAPYPRPILKKRNCCQCTPGYCICQPLPRNCNCPPPVQVDARADRECSCDCPSSPECACPPSERRFPRTMVRCPNARLCCPLPRLPPGPKCHCTDCQPCLPPPCSPCTSDRCRTVLPKIRPCNPDPTCCPSSSCRRDATVMETSGPRRSTPCDTCWKVSPCADRRTGGSDAGSSRLCRSSRPSSPNCRGQWVFRLETFETNVTRGVVHPVGVSDVTTETPYARAHGNEWENGSACSSVCSYVRNIGHSTLVPGPLALVSFVLLIIAAVGLSSAVALYDRYSVPKKTCLRYSGR